MHRRSFLNGLVAAAATTAISPLALAAASRRPNSGPKIKLGMDNFAVRAMAWKAPELIDYAASLKLDTLLISDLDAFVSLDDAKLRDVKRKADDAGIALYVGSWSICPSSKVFRPNRGTAEQHLRLGIRVAKALGSPVFRAVLGNMEDRKTEGGIKARIADTIGVLKQCRNDVAAFGRATCNSAPSSEVQQQCEAELAPCKSAGEQCKYLACVDRFIGNFSDGRLRMVGQ